LRATLRSCPPAALLLGGPGELVIEAGGGDDAIEFEDLGAAAPKPTPSW